MKPREALRLLLPYLVTLLVLSRWLGYFYNNWGPAYPPPHYLILARCMGAVEIMAVILWLLERVRGRLHLPGAGMLLGLIGLRLLYLQISQAIDILQLDLNPGSYLDILQLALILYYLWLVHRSAFQKPHQA